MAQLDDLAKHGQAIWIDYIRRQFLEKGELDELLEKGLRGMTSNPSIFDKAIAGSSDYDDQLRELADSKLSEEEIFEKLALKDIANAADKMKPVFDKTKGLDGLVSLEVSPKLAHETEKTISEAKKYFKELNRPNVMIKVPATKEGIPAITELISSGVNVNVTLMFSKENYIEVANAYLEGLENLDKEGKDLSRISSVASFFVSRVDVKVDRKLDKLGNKDLKGKIGIANSKDVYREFQKIFSSARWEKLSAKNAKVQRVLWASTSTKNPEYPDTLYVDSLIGAHTVNTLPPKTFHAFLDHGTISDTLIKDVDGARKQLEKLEKLEISLAKVTDELQSEGVKKFADSYDSLLESLKEKLEKLKKGSNHFIPRTGKFEKQIDKRLDKIKNEKIVERTWRNDFTVWSDKPDEIVNRLSWLHSPEITGAALDEIYEFVEEVRKEGFENAIVLGMGGSSMAPEVFSKMFGTKKGFLDLHVLDSTDPGAIIAYDKMLDPVKTLYIVSTKSGSTVETFSYMKHFYNSVINKVGKENSGKHFIAVTDPKSGLINTAEELKFRKIFRNDPNIGGRYSALSFFGMVPAALCGVDLKKIIDRAERMVCNSEGANCPVTGDNTGAHLGAIMGELANEGIDKVTFITPGKVSYFGAWVEQLIAESTGKNGKGILPIDGESVQKHEYYSRDRLFVYIHLKDDNSESEKVNELDKAGHPVVEIIWNDIYNLGSEYFRWEFAITIAGWAIGIQPFNQPNVEAAKVLAKKMVKEYQEKGKLPELKPVLEQNGISVFGDIKADKLENVLKDFLDNFDAGKDDFNGRSYVAIQAYVKPEEKTSNELQNFRTAIQKKYKVATTVGYGPRFLHSTGQLHKGDAGHGLFIQFVSEMPGDLPIPDKAGGDKSSISFGTLKNAQALGDRQALLDNNRRVIRFNLGKDVNKGLETLTNSLN